MTNAFISSRVPISIFSFRLWIAPPLGRITKATCLFMIEKRDASNFLWECFLFQPFTISMENILIHLSKYSEICKYRAGLHKCRYILLSCLKTFPLLLPHWLPELAHKIKTKLSTTYAAPLCTGIKGSRPLNAASWAGNPSAACFRRDPLFLLSSLSSM